MMRKRERGGEWLLSALLVFGTVGANIKFNPIVTAHRSGYFSRLPHRRQIHTALAQIPPQAGVATVNPLGPHLVHRRYLIALEKYHRHLRHDHLRYVDYVLLDLVDCRLFHTQDPRSDYADMVHEILDTQQFDVRYWSGRVLLLERGEPSAQALDDVRAYVDKLEAEGRPCWP